MPLWQQHTPEIRMKNPLALRPTEKAPRPVESFGPELLTALLKGATQEVSVPMTWKQAIRFRQRVHSMREAMRRTSHPKYELCSRVAITIELPLGTPTEVSGRHRIPTDRNIGVRVILSPNDSQFGPLLAAAGIRTPEEIAATTESVVPQAEPTLDTLEAMFGDIKKEPH